MQWQLRGHSSRQHSSTSRSRHSKPTSSSSSPRQQGAAAKRQQVAAAAKQQGQAAVYQAAIRRATARADGAWLCSCIGVTECVSEQDIGQGSTCISGLHVVVGLQPSVASCGKVCCIYDCNNKGWGCVVMRAVVLLLVVVQPAAVLSGCAQSR